MKQTPFNPQWLQRRLVRLLPTYPDANLCVALSGGLDSTTLLAALATHTRKRLRKRTKLRAVHVHHGLHSNADEWSAQCSQLAERLHVPLTILRVKIARPRGTSLEAAARDARYAALAEVLEPDEVLLTAHHEDDQLETVFLQLMRGAGIAGLAAMPEVAPFARGTLVRPLLTRSRAELESWARENELSWVDDDTNKDEQLDRNYLRRRVMPLIRERWPSAARAVSRSARHAAEARRLLDALALADVERASNGLALSVQYLRTLSLDRRRNAVRFWIARAGHVLPDATRLEEIVTTLLEARSDANPVVDWNTTRIQRHVDHLTLLHPEALNRRAAESARAAGRESHRTRESGGTEVGLAQLERSSSATPAENEVTAWNWRARSRSSPKRSWGALSINPNAHGSIDLDALPSILTIRHRKGGERLRPARGGPSKSLKQLIQEARIPLAERATLPLLFAGEKLVAIADRWLDASIQTTNSTQNRGRLRWHRK